MKWAVILSPCCLDTKRETFTTFPKVSHLRTKYPYAHAYMPTDRCGIHIYMYT